MMPNVTTLTTKALQLEALRTVRCHASTHYKSILKQKEQMTVMLRVLDNSTTRRQSLHTGTVSDTHDAATYHGQSYFQQRASLAETTIARYNNNDTNVNPNYKNKETKIETRLHPETGL